MFIKKKDKNQQGRLTVLWIYLLSVQYGVTLKCIVIFVCDRINIMKIEIKMKKSNVQCEMYWLQTWNYPHMYYMFM